MRVSKWGNSLAARLPGALVNDLELKATALKSYPQILIARRCKGRTQDARDRTNARPRSAHPADYAFDRVEASAR